MTFATCAKCELQGSPVTKGKGSSKATFAFVGEGPSQLEARLEQIFSGPGGQLLKATLRSAGIEFKDVYLTNAVKCHMPGQAKMSIVRTCKPNLINELAEVQPRVVVAMGTYAMRALLERNVTISEVRGYTFWSDELKAYVVPTYHPNAIIHSPNLFEDFGRDLLKAKNAAELPPGGIKTPEPFTYTCDSKKRAKRILKAVARMKDRVISCDVETDGFNYFTDDILSIGIGVSDNTAIIFPKHIIEDPDLALLFNEAFANPDVIWVFQNGKFDVQFLRAPSMPEVFGKEKRCVVETARCDFDTMLAHYQIDERQGTHGLKVWAREYFDAPDWEEDIKQYLPTKDTPYSAIPKEKLHKYQGYDVVYTRKGYFKFDELMREEGTRDYFYKILMPAQRAFTEIELEGIRVNIDLLREKFESAQTEIELARTNLEQAAINVGWDPLKYCQDTGAKSVPQSFNPESHPQLSYVAYDLCKMPLFEGKKTCNKDAVEVYQHKHPFWKALAEYKQVSDLFGTFVKGLLKQVYADGKVRPNFLLHGTVTGRLSCHAPNMQNIPRDSFVKDFFIPDDEDSVIVNLDYKTLEVIVAALLSDDPDMKAPFIEGADYHMATAKNVFAEQLASLEMWCATKDRKSIREMVMSPMLSEIREKINNMLAQADCDFDKVKDEITDYYRFLTKFITFGIMYGRKAPSLAHGELNCTVNEAQLYIDNFFKRYEKFHQWMLKMEKQAVEEGFVQTAFGHKRRWSFITNDNIYSVKNQAVNTPIQGTASQICMIALTRLHNEFKRNGWGRVLFTVHDSIVINIKKAHLQEALTLMENVATDVPLETDVPFRVDLEVGPTYNSVERVKFEGGRWVPAHEEYASDWLKEVCGVA